MTSIRNRIGRNSMTKLGKGDGFRLELPVADATRAMERLQHAAKAAKINLIVDQVAHARLAKPQWKTNYVVYAEELSPADLRAGCRPWPRPTNKPAAKKACRRLARSVGGAAH